MYAFDTITMRQCTADLAGPLESRRSFSYIVYECRYILSKTWYGTLMELLFNENIPPYTRMRLAYCAGVLDDKPLRWLAVKLVRNVMYKPDEHVERLLTSAERVLREELPADALRWKIERESNEVWRLRSNDDEKLAVAAAATRYTDVRVAVKATYDAILLSERFRAAMSPRPGAQLLQFLQDILEEYYMLDAGAYRAAADRWQAIRHIAQRA